jgi:hypothetical protein
MSKSLLESLQIVGAFRPVDLQGGTNAGDWVSLKNYKKCLILFHSAIGTAGDDPVVTLLQASAVAGTGSKALNISRVFKKQAASNLLSTGQWSDASAGVTANAWTNADAAEQELLLAIEVNADELDVDNGFDCVSISVADVGTNAQLGAAYYILAEPRYPAQATAMLSAIAD